MVRLATTSPNGGILEYTMATKGKLIKTTTTPSTATKKGNNKVGWRWRHASYCYGVVSITKDGNTQEYFLSEIDPHRVYTLQKLEAKVSTTYLVTLGNNPTCGCVGGKRHGKCKHVDGLNAMIVQGKL